MLIYNAKIITMTGKNLNNGFVRFENGKITEIGNSETLKNVSNFDFNAEGKTLYPGFVDAHTHVGVFGDGLGFEGSDANEITDPITPHLRAVDAINPLDFCFSEAAAGGITTTVTGVGSANPIGGNLAAVKTHGGKRLESRIIKSTVAIKMALGENPKTCYNTRDETPITRMATAALIREQLYKAMRYKESVNVKDNDDLPEYDIKCEALLPLLDREIKVHFHCHRADDIFTAIRIAEEFNLDYVLVHATDGSLIAEELGEIKADIIVGPIICDRSKPELVNLSIKTAAKLSQQGLEIALCSDHPVMPVQLLPLAAGLLIRGGLSEYDALKAITINAAKICGISDRVGSIEIGKDADFVLFDSGTAFYDAASEPYAVFIGGERLVPNA